jgi:hypothetical protein
MADDPLLPRLRAMLSGEDVTEQKMFGGVCFMLSGNMLIGTSKRGLLVRVGKDAHAAAVVRPHARPMEMGGRTMEGYVFVAPAGTKGDNDLAAWIGRARAFVDTLPAKTRAKKRAAKRATKSR